MFDAETVTTHIGAAPETKGTPTRPISLLKRNCARKLTRAHLALARRPALATAARAALAQVGEDLSRALATPIALDARIIDSAINPFGGLSKFSAFALIELEAIGGLGVLELDLLTLNLLLAKVAGSPARTSAPTRLTQIEEAAFGWLCLSALAPLRACELVQRVLGPRLLAVFIDRAEILERVDCRVRHVAIDVTLRIGDARGAGRLLLPAPALETAVAPIDETLPAEPAPEVAAAQITVHPFLGRCVLDARDMAGLQLGDVVMLDGVRCPGTLIGSARLTTATFELHGTFTPAGFTLTRAETRATSLPQEPTVKTKPDAHPPLPVEVEVELTRLRLPISELATLRAGAVLPLRIGSNDPVVLRVGDRAVARAELVDIEGEIGARIIGLLK